MITRASLLQNKGMRTREVHWEKRYDKRKIIEAGEGGWLGTISRRKLVPVVLIKPARARRSAGVDARGLLAASGYLEDLYN